MTFKNTDQTRNNFLRPDNLIYLDGNSLGMLPKHVPERVAHTINQEWGTRLIRSWNEAWVDLPERVAARIAKLVGAKAQEISVGDSTSINIYKALLAALQLQPNKKVIVSEMGNFPTDLYIAEGITKLLGGYELRFVEKNQIKDAIKNDVAVVMLTEVDYRTGERIDMHAISQHAHANGALTLWDLSHSAGAFPVALNNCNVDFAAGCGYKYLNGGPGAPAFIFVAERHHNQTIPVLSGWLGHKAPFDFLPQYHAGNGIKRMTVGTPPVLSLVSLEAALEMFDDIEMQTLRQESLALTDLFIELMRPLAEEHGFTLLTPLAHEQRGSQVSYASTNGYPIVRALISAQVIGDFRAPNIMRFGFTPLYINEEDVREAVKRFLEIMKTKKYLEPEFQERLAVT